jgi:hypothetical protein
VSDTIRKNINNVDDYDIGEILVCRTYINLNKGNHNCQLKLIHNIVKIESDFLH